MKRLFTQSCAAILLLLVPFSVFAQPKFIMKADLALANVMGDDVDNNKVLPTFLLGGHAEFGLGGSLGLDVGVEVAGKGFKVEESAFEGRINPIYLQVPVQLTFRAGGVFVGVGPFVGMGIAGKSKADGEEENIDFGSDLEDDYSSLDYGAGLELGYEFGALRAFVSYNHGFANVVPKDQADLFDVKVTSSVIGVGLAYILGGNK
ncbi:MAG: PorT family protein [Bacteroidetes bacterium]|nr:MAG: PorT family protein [Bacteroidota bacterium]